jgi:hypothetical protein
VPDDLNSRLPASVTTTFAVAAHLGADAPRVAYEVALVSLGLQGAPGVTGYPGTVLVRSSAVAGPGTPPANDAELLALARQVATDWYGFAVAALDRAWAGVVAWDPEGITDWLEVRQTPGGQMLTRVFSEPPGASADLYHFSSRGAADDAPAGVFWAVNVGDSEAPAYGLVLVTGARTDGLLEVRRPTDYGQRVMASGPLPIPAGGTGQVSNAWPLYVLYDSAQGTPSNGQRIWGAGRDSYLLKASYTLGAADGYVPDVTVLNHGFKVVGAPVDGRALVQEAWPAVRTNHPGPGDAGSVVDVSEEILLDQAAGITYNVHGLSLIPCRADHAGGVSVGTGVQQMGNGYKSFDGLFLTRLGLPAYTGDTPSAVLFADPGGRFGNMWQFGTGDPTSYTPGSPVLWGHPAGPHGGALADNFFPGNVLFPSSGRGGIATGKVIFPNDLGPPNPFDTLGNFAFLSAYQASSDATFNLGWSDGTSFYDVAVISYSAGAHFSGVTAGGYAVAGFGNGQTGTDPYSGLFFANGILVGTGGAGYGDSGTGPVLHQDGQTVAGPTLKNPGVLQKDDGDTALQITRATDAAPAGNFETFKSAAGAALWNVDINGNLTDGTIDGGTWP